LANGNIVSFNEELKVNE